MGTAKRLMDLLELAHVTLAVPLLDLEILGDLASVGDRAYQHDEDQPGARLLRSLDRDDRRRLARKRLRLDAGHLPHQGTQRVLQLVVASVHAGHVLARDRASARRE